MMPTMPAGGQREREVLDQQPVAEALADAVGLDHLVAEARPRRDVDLDRVELDVALLGEQALVVVQARLGLRAPALRVLAHPLELGGDRALARGLLALLLLQALLLLLEPARVVALERQAGAAVELEDPARDVVEEVAIVGDRDDRALVLLEVLLEPGDRLGVEVVRGLVEQQQVGRREQQPAERDAAALAAGERGHVGVGRREAQGVHRLVELRVEVPGVGGVDLLLDAGELVGRLVGVVGRQLVEAVEQRAGLGDAVLDVAAHVLGLVELGLLLEQPDGGAGRELRLAAVLGVLPGHDPQERRLAGAVEAQHADLRAGEEGERDVLQHLLVRRVRPAQPVHRIDVLARHVV